MGMDVLLLVIAAIKSRLASQKAVHFNRWAKRGARERASFHARLRATTTISH